MTVQHPATIRAAALRLLGEAWRFGTVGVAGFGVDALVLTGAMLLGSGPYLGRVASYLAAASTTFALNRAWTFRGRAAQPVARQWTRFLAVNLAGFGVNYGTYALLVANAALVARSPVLGVAAGSLAGMTGNFLLSRWLVFAGPPGVPRHAA